MERIDRSVLIHRVRTALIPVLLLGTAAVMLAWHGRQMWERGRCERIVDLREKAQALRWAPDTVRTEISSRFHRSDLLSWTKHASGPVRQAAAWAIGHVGSSTDVPVLLVALQHRDPRTASAAVDALWQLWLNAGPAEAAAELQQGRQLLDRGRVTEALWCFNRTIIRWPELAEPYNQRARVFMIEGDYAAAIRDCSAAIARNPSHFDTLARLGECYARLGETDESIRRFQQALAINPHLGSVWRRIAELRESAFAAAGERLNRT